MKTDSPEIIEKRYRGTMVKQMITSKEMINKNLRNYIEYRKCCKRENLKKAFKDHTA